VAALAVLLQQCLCQWAPSCQAAVCHHHCLSSKLMGCGWS
jgi:hypothetical protein